MSTLALVVVEEVEVAAEEEQAAGSLLDSEATDSHAVQDPGLSLGVCIMMDINR